MIPQDSEQRKRWEYAAAYWREIEAEARRDGAGSVDMVAAMAADRAAFYERLLTAAFVVAAP